MASQSTSVVSQEQRQVNLNQTADFKQSSNSAAAGNLITSEGFLPGVRVHRFSSSSIPPSTRAGTSMSSVGHTCNMEQCSAISTTHGMSSPNWCSNSAELQPGSCTTYLLTLQPHRSVKMGHALATVHIVAKHMVLNSSTILQSSSGNGLYTQPSDTWMLLSCALHH